MLPTPHSRTRLSTLTNLAHSRCSQVVHIALGFSICRSLLQLDIRENAEIVGCQKYAWAQFLPLASLPTLLLCFQVTGITRESQTTLYDDSNYGQTAPSPLVKP